MEELERELYGSFRASVKLNIEFLTRRVPREFTERDMQNNVTSTYAIELRYYYRRFVIAGGVTCSIEQFNIESSING